MQNLTIDLDQETLETAKNQAQERGLTVEAFLIELLRDAMHRREEEKQPTIRKLSNRDRDIFLAMMDADDQPNEKLIDAFRTQEKLINS